MAWSVGSVADCGPSGHADERNLSSVYSGMSAWLTKQVTCCRPHASSSTCDASARRVQRIAEADVQERSTRRNASTAAHKVFPEYTRSSTKWIGVAGARR